MTIPKQLQELQANVEDLTKKYKEVKTTPDENHKDKMAEMEDTIFRLIGYVSDRISYLENDFYNWTNNHAGSSHLPPILGAGKMEKALDICYLIQLLIIEKSLWINIQKQ